MLTLVKMQHISTLMWKNRNLRAEHFESYSSYSYCTHSSIHQVFQPSGLVVDLNILNLCWPSTTGTMPLITRILCGYNMMCTSANNKQKYEKLSFPSLIRILHYVMSLLYKYNILESVIVKNIIPRKEIINRGAAEADNHISRDDIFDYHTLKNVIFILFYRTLFLHFLPFFL